MTLITTSCPACRDIVSMPPEAGMCARCEGLARAMLPATPCKHPPLSGVFGWGVVVGLNLMGAIGLLTGHWK